MMRTIDRNDIGKVVLEMVPESTSWSTTRENRLLAATGQCRMGQGCPEVRKEVCVHRDPCPLLYFTWG